eukprot:CAMPEP_0202976070 /NCGR_PEP_ID=MMETSP1396-20130829/74170_1 /ASSEMBLY_ACC=CAM_ASM_000872 /TAXON_ID= /ORGANISM="Pseudokeronopsis sp., Strain Brazil" /LENGTH=135 /DNA_ID=CAMNT_0049712737 /DNA_START=25 /DNA_END=428 /DNA_ORIENTATION=-
MAQNIFRQRFVRIALFVVLTILVFVNPTRGDDDFKELKDELAQMKREGRHEDVLRLHATIKQQIDEKYREQLAATPKVTGNTQSVADRHRPALDRHDRRRQLDLETMDDLPPHVREHAERRKRYADSPRRSLGPA